MAGPPGPAVAGRPEGDAGADPLRCVHCGYDLKGLTCSRRSDVRCPECGDANALGVRIRCARCGFDLAGHAVSHGTWVRCPECGENDAAREPVRRPGIPEPFRSLLIVAAGLGQGWLSVWIGAEIGFSSRHWWRAGLLALVAMGSASAAIVAAASFLLSLRAGQVPPETRRVERGVLVLCAVAFTVVAVALASVTAC